MENFQSAYIIFLNNVENLDPKEQNNSPLNSRWANWSSASRLLHSTRGGLKNILEPKIFGHLCAVGQIYGEVVGCYEIRQELFTLSFAITDPAIFHLFPCFYSLLVQRLLWLWERNMIYGPIYIWAISSILSKIWPCLSYFRTEYEI